MAYMPVRKDDLLGVHTELVVRCCVSLTPSVASRSMLGVGNVVLPKQPKSPIPMSSASKINTFGDCFLNPTHVVVRTRKNIIMISDVIVNCEHYKI